MAVAQSGQFVFVENVLFDFTCVVRDHPVVLPFD